MAGLPCAVVLAVFLVLARFANGYLPYKCEQYTFERGLFEDRAEPCLNYWDTGSHMTNAERERMVDSMNYPRALIANQCDQLKSGKPKSAMFKKIRYSCALEAENKITCADFDYKRYPEHYFESDWYIRYDLPVSNETTTSLAQIRVQIVDQIDINPENQRLRDEYREANKWLHFFLTEDAEEIGCYTVKCPIPEDYYPPNGHRVVFKCSTGQKRKWRGQLYKPGERCHTDADCTEVGYTVCDQEYGLCEKGNPRYECENPIRAPPMLSRKEMCFRNKDKNPGNEIGDNERESIADVMNLWRGMIANQCDKFKNVKPKSALFAKIQYSCDLEEKAKFDCPASSDSDAFLSDDEFLRIISDVPFPDKTKRLALMHVSSPRPDEIDIDPITQELKSAPRGANALRFFLNGVATEVGCFVKKCHDKEYASCTTGKAWKQTGPLYTPGKRCETDADCRDRRWPNHKSCNKEFGLCVGEDLKNLKCTVNSDDVVDNLCAYVRSCVTDFCKALVLIVQNSDKGYEVVGVGAAVGPEYILSSVSSRFIKHSRNDLYIVVEGSKMYPFYNADGTDSAYAETFLGHFNLTRWQDLVLIKLGASGVKFTNVLTLNGQKALPDKMKTLATKDKNFEVVEQSLASPADCEKMFQKDVFKYSEDYNMACAKDSEDFVTSFLSGAPMAVMEDGKFVLYGLRSLGSIDPASQTGHLITPIKPYCDWFKSVSNGAVKCT